MGKPVLLHTDAPMDFEVPGLVSQPPSALYFSVCGGFEGAEAKTGLPGF